MAALTSYAWGGWGSRSSDRLSALQERDLCLGGQKNRKLCLRALDQRCISQFVVRAVWKALACGSIHEMSDNGAEEGSGELVNLAEAVLTHGGECCSQGQSYRENSAGGSKINIPKVLGWWVVGAGVR